jgi:hypothetical protein
MKKKELYQSSGNVSLEEVVEGCMGLDKIKMKTYKKQQIPVVVQ